MTSSRPGKPTRSSFSAIALVECSVRVSPTLARLIRKSAEKEVSGTSAKDALLTADIAIIAVPVLLEGLKRREFRRAFWS